MQHGMVKTLNEKQPEGMNSIDWKELETRVASTIRLCLVDEVMYHVMDEKSPIAIWMKLESQYVLKSLINKLLLKKKLYGPKMIEGEH